MEQRLTTQFQWQLTNTVTGILEEFKSIRNSVEILKNNSNKSLNIVSPSTNNSNNNNNSNNENNVNTMNSSKSNPFINSNSPPPNPNPYIIPPSNNSNNSNPQINPNNPNATTSFPKVNIPPLPSFSLSSLPSSQSAPLSPSGISLSHISSNPFLSPDQQS